MKVFICGGGSGVQTEKAVRRLNEVIRHDLPCLYIPLAMEEEQYDGCREWITGELDSVDIPGIEMVRSAEELARKRLADYSFLFIGGGNTFRLLSEIKRVNMMGPIREYLRNGGAAFGGSAGAIIFGEDLESCALDDENEVGLEDTEGFDVLDGISFLCHFTSRDPEHDRRSGEYLLEVSKHRKVYALPEEDTLFLNGTRLEEIGGRPYYIFEDGKMTGVWPAEKERYTCKIASPEEMDRRWDDEIRRHPGDENWVAWKGEAAESFRAGLSLPYYGILDGAIICEATAALDPDFPRDGGKTGERAVELCAFRTVREHRGKGYFSKLMDFLLRDLKQRGYTEAVVGVEPEEKLNREMYRHWGFTERVGTGTETYPDGTVIDVEFYGRKL